jgi:hypothetical integral membrane protein (TIGR02206 family)
MTGSEPPFELFGAAHLSAMLAIIVGGVVLPVAVRRAGSGAERPAAIGLATLLVGHELFKMWMRVTVYGQPLAESLPLHLCNAATFLVAYLLVRRSYGAFEIAYFWGVAGSAQAVLTPDLPQGFPSLLFLTFFVGHGLVIVGICYAVMVLGFRPTLRSAGKAILATLIYMAVIAPVNLLLDTNYMYLRHKPAGASLIDYFGPWPWYLLALIGAGVVSCFVVYAPFAWLEARSRRHAA